mmetsp:Transcript_56273/g.163134  ORF Transcript_56273/g.163134 Transcript_56273/m.163134 type:complete len:243 (-) Transcript_56273:336-1064(-)
MCQILHAFVPLDVVDAGHRVRPIVWREEFVEEVGRRMFPSGSLDAETDPLGDHRARCTVGQKLRRPLQCPRLIAFHVNFQNIHRSELVLFQGAVDRRHLDHVATLLGTLLLGQAVFHHGGGGIARIHRHAKGAGCLELRLPCQRLRDYADAVFPIVQFHRRLEEFPVPWERLRDRDDHARVYGQGEQGRPADVPANIKNVNALGARFGDDLDMLFQKLGDVGLHHPVLVNLTRQPAVKAVIM